MKNKGIEDQSYYVENIRNSYIFPFSLLNIIIWIKYIFVVSYCDMWDEIPIFAYCYFAFSIVLWVVLFFQIKISKESFSINLIRRYIMVNIVVGYNIAIGYGNIYFLNMIDHFNLINIWLLYLSLVALSAFGIYMFGTNSFKEYKTRKSEFSKILGGIISLLATGSIMILGFFVPTVYDVHTDIFYSGILVFCVHLLMIRTFACYVLLKESIKEHGVLI